MYKLGFGMMRLPLADPKEQTAVDRERTRAMMDVFLERGFTYVDTAYFYHGGESERVVRDVLTSRYPRERYTLADKMPLARLKGKGTAEDQARIFDEQLEKCGVAYFDRYLLHCLNTANYETAKRLDTFAFLREKMAEGKFRHLGFSFHDKAEVLDQILTEHPEAEFVQLQLNYLDWEDERIQSRKCYETAVRHGKKVVVMEPVKGGRLARLPEEAEKLLRAVHPDWSPASWAIRFAASLPEVEMVLSGMSDMAQLEDNTGCGHPLAAAIGAFNPCWDEDDDPNQNFEEAVTVAKAILTRKIAEVNGIRRAGTLVKAAVAQMQDRIVTLDRYAPWKSFVVDSDALFVVSPSQRGGFSAQAVPMSQQDNALRLPFPESWAGKSADELQSLTGIATLRFCHNNRFLISADTKEDAIAACHLTMEAAK